MYVNRGTDTFVRGESTPTTAALLFHKRGDLIETTVDTKDPTLVMTKKLTGGGKLSMNHDVGEYVEPENYSSLVGVGDIPSLDIHGMYEIGLQHVKAFLAHKPTGSNDEVAEANALLSALGQTTDQFDIDIDIREIPELLPPKRFKN